VRIQKFPWTGTAKNGSSNLPGNTTGAMANALTIKIKIPMVDGKRRWPRRMVDEVKQLYTARM
jgi:hypothetical protein